MKLFSEVARLKLRARREYESYANERDKYDCGASMAHHVNPRLNELAEAFNNTMDVLSRVDPECPKSRIELK
jgi:hypothetical protein